MAEDDFVTIDRAFRRLVKTSARVERRWSGARWSEGPAWFEALQSLVFSDIPNDRLLRFDATTGAVGALRAGQGRFTNGNTVDRQGRLVSCEHGTRQLTRTEPDGAITVLADRFEAKRFNSPNDVVVKSDDTIWFTDPGYGIDSDYEGFKGESELDGDFVFRLDVRDRSLRVVADDFVRPNGLAFSPDERRLYIADSGGSNDDDGPRHLRVFDVADDGRLSGGAVIATCDVGVYDGFRVDTAGRIWTSAGDGVHALTPDGALLGKIRVPERVANLCFAGPRRNVMLITATTSLYEVRLPVNGVKTY
ncbi:MAG: SMP-30/gluconolactonase/LRE family protein [Alphaproteobacteria bacterium]